MDGMDLAGAMRKDKVVGAHILKFLMNEEKHVLHTWFVVPNCILIDFQTELQGDHAFLTTISFSRFFSPFFSSILLSFQL